MPKPCETDIAGERIGILLAVDVARSALSPGITSRAYVLCLASKKSFFLQLQSLASKIPTLTSRFGELHPQVLAGYLTSAFTPFKRGSLGRGCGYVLSF